jgi:hypothetical protein
MTKVMATSPALLRGYLALSGALNGGELPAAVRERLAGRRSAQPRLINRAPSFAARTE